MAIDVSVARRLILGHRCFLVDMVSLSDLPGISDENNLPHNLIIGSFYLLLVLIVIGGVLPGDDGGETTQAGATPTPTPDNAEAQEQTAAETQADTEAPTETATPEPTDTPEPTPTEEEGLSDEESLQAIETVIESYDITVESVEREGDTIQLSYSSTQTTQRGIAEEMGYVSGAYAGAVAEGESADRMEVEVYTVTGELAGTFHVERKWAVQYNNDEISNTEFSQRILQTLEAT